MTPLGGDGRAFSRCLGFALILLASMVGMDGGPEPDRS
jgi:hypothetical protein